MGTSLGVADTMALDLVQAEQPRAVLVRAPSSSTTRTPTRCAAASPPASTPSVIEQIAVRSGEGLTGWVARNRRAARQRAAERRLRGRRARAGAHQRCSQRWSARSIFNERFIGTLAVYHVEPAYYPTTTAACSTASRNRRARSSTTRCVFEQTQEDSLTDPLTGLPNTRFHVHAPDARARARRAPQVGGVAAGDGPRRVQGDQRQPRPPRRRPGAARGGARCCATAIRPYDICVRYAGDEFIVVLSGCSADEAEHKRRELQKRIDEMLFEARPGQASAARHQRRRGRVPAGRRSYESLLATADSRMYQDKAGRKRRGGREAGRREAIGDDPVRRHHRDRHPARRRRDPLASSPKPEAPPSEHQGKIRACDLIARVDSVRRATPSARIVRVALDGRDFPSPPARPRDRPGRRG